MPDVDKAFRRRKRARVRRRRRDTCGDPTAIPTNKESDMKKAICAMKAAMGVRGIGWCSGWRWVLYHNI